MNNLIIHIILIILFSLMLIGAITVAQSITDFIHHQHIITIIVK